MSWRDQLDRALAQAARDKHGIPTPVEPFRTIVADPAWQFDDALPGDSRGASKNYQTMTVDDLCRMIIPAPVADDAHLFMWRVSALVPEAYRVVRAWKFTAKSELVWRKLTTKGNRHFGMGHHVRAEHETCIIATRGRSKVLNRSTRSVFDADEIEAAKLAAADAALEGDYEAARAIRQGLFTGGMFSAKYSGHSAKPDEFFEIVEALCPGPYLELFARRPRPGWTCLGNELGTTFQIKEAP